MLFLNIETDQRDEKLHPEKEGSFPQNCHKGISHTSEIEKSIWRQVQQKG